MVATSCWLAQRLRHLSKFDLLLHPARANLTHGISEAMRQRAGVVSDMCGAPTGRTESGAVLPLDAQVADG